MLRLFADNLLPVFLIAAVGAAVAARFRLDPRPLSSIAFLVFSPCLIYDILAQNRLPAAALLRMVGFTCAGLFVVAIVAGLIAWRLGWSRTMVAAVFLVVLLPNAANLGMPVNLFAFGDEGLAQASVFFATSATLTFTVGVFVASLGRASLGPALLGLLRVPTIWAVALAALLAILIAISGELFVGWLTELSEVRDAAIELLPWIIAAPLISVWAFHFDGVFIGTTQTETLRNCMFVAASVYLLLIWLGLEALGNQILWVAMMVFMGLRGALLAWLSPGIERQIEDQ